MARRQRVSVFALAEALHRIDRSALFVGTRIAERRALRRPAGFIAPLDTSAVFRGEMKAAFAARGRVAASRRAPGALRERDVMPAVSGSDRTIRPLVELEGKHTNRRGRA
jgi:hypothetical protein